MSLASQILKRYFGYDAFRNGQSEAIDAILAGRDLLCVMPTGAGKSVCYQIPAMLLGGVAVVISPLISLMKDQVDSLEHSGIHACAIHSGMEWSHVKPVFREARDGSVKILYIAPERLSSEGFKNFLNDIDISMVVVDEAHCVSHWGHDFRPSYMSIAPVVDSLDRRPIVAAFTATATPDVRDDIAKQLSLHTPKTIVTGFDRENLFFQIERPSDKTLYLKSYLRKFPDMPGIVYCSTRKAVESVCDDLRAMGVNAVRYHAGLDERERSENQEAFIFDRASVMVATNAFGMGIDKSNVRFVIHYNMPGSIDSYYQEAGRAGRDGAPADCILLFSRGDINTIRFLISQIEDAEAKETAQKNLASMTAYANSSSCLRANILRYFGERDVPDKCGSCGNCSSVLERTDITIDAQKILSCVFRMTQKAGGSYDRKLMSGALRGSRAAQIKELGFDTITTWGIMKGATDTYIQNVTDFLIFEELLREAADGGLSFTEKSMPFLKNGTRLMMREYADKAAEVLPCEDDEAPTLFNDLRELRKSIAARENVPPYIIFTDKTLLAISEMMPENEHDLLAVPGVGQVKLERYGSEFIDAVRAWRSHPRE